MSALLDRARQALAPRYEVEVELGAGGMGAVFLAHDRRLDRQVAIKVLPPELASASAAERFQREARILARLGHPNVVPIHEVGEAQGLLYYVMDRMQGETLAARLRRGPLDYRLAARLGSDLLAALDAAHRAGIVHRDVKPSNIFLVEERALLADFGISRLSDSADTTLTAAGQQPGTPGYMPPEQAAGEEATPRTDLYAVGIVLFEAITGRRWSILESPERADWHGVARRPARVLRRALAWDPQARWPTAAAFREAWRRAHARPYGRAIAGVGLGAFVIGYASQFVLDGGPRGDQTAAGTRRLADLGLVPFEARPSDSAFARDVAWLVYHNLAGRPWLTLTPTGTAYCAPDTAGHRPAAWAETEPHFAARFRASGALIPLPGHADSILVEVAVVDSSGNRTVREVRGTRREQDQTALANAIALEVLEAIRPDMARPYRGLAGLRDRSPQALKAFLLGEQALRCDEHRVAEAHFAEAVRLDPTFALAAWRLAIARRWLQKPPDLDLTDIRLRHASDLSPLDRSLLEAFVEPGLDARLARYEAVVREYPRDGFARLLYGDELFHRGPLAGRPVELALLQLDSARSLDPLLSLASDHLLQLQIRLGLQGKARATLQHLQAVTVVPSADGAPQPGVPDLLRHAFLERFHPDSAAAVIDGLFGPPEGGFLPVLLFSARWGLSLGIPHTQQELGRRLVAAAGAEPADRATGLVAEGLALIHLGRPRAALARFDTAAIVHRTPELRVHAGEWRVVPSALGTYPLDPGERERGARELAAAFAEREASPRIRARAAFALAFDALESGRLAEARAWTDTLRALAAAEGASGLALSEQLLDVGLAVREGRPSDGMRGVLETMGHQAAADSAGRMEQPFRRATAYLWRASWAESAERSDEALRHLLWHTANDIAGLALGPAQAGEVDWALGPYARLRSARVALAAADTARACAVGHGLAALWRDAEESLHPLRAAAERLEREACGP